MPKQPKRKKRDEYIYATTKGDVTEIGLSVDPMTGAIRFSQEMVNVYAEVSYDRPKGPKVLSRVPQRQRDVSFDAIPALESNYDFVCAVDTNTRLIGSKNVSVVAVVVPQTIWIPEKDGLTRYWKFNVPFCLEYVEVKSTPENFGWLVAYERLLREGCVEKGKKMGMIVDSDLGSLNDYNARRRPVDGADYLPEQVTLLYASADAGKENLVNKALSAADSAANQCLAAINDGKVPSNYKPSGSSLFESMRLIIPNLVWD